MQVLCMAIAHPDCDVQCPHCDQKYKIYYSRQNKTECDEALASVLIALTAHHANHPLIDPSIPAHPADAFTVPAWNGPLHTCGAALLSGAPIIRAAAPRSNLPPATPLLTAPLPATPSPIAPSPISLVPPTTQQQQGQQGQQRRVS